jgi:predicted phage tail protein
MNSKLRTFHIHGNLGKQFSNEYKLAVDSITEGIRGICMQVKGFELALRDGEYKVFRGNPESKSGIQLSESMLGVGLGDVEDIHIIPVASGSKRNGIGKIILGIVLVAAAFFTAGGTLAAGVSASAMQATAFAGITYGQIAMVGISLILSGISQLLTPIPNTDDMTAKENPSFLFDGPFNTSRQGSAIPLVYGIFRVGSIVASAGIRNEQITDSTESTGKVSVGSPTPDYSPFEDPYS